MITDTDLALPPPGRLSDFASGFRFSWPTLLLLLAINTGIAVLLSIEDKRPFWHPFVSAQTFGLTIAYFINVAKPWASARPVRRLLWAVAIGTLLAIAILVVAKGYVIGDENYQFASVRKQLPWFAWTALSAFIIGICVGFFFLFRYREAHAAAVLHKAESERLLMSKHAVEAELKLMQAQVEPHFLFNTLASVQYLTETDPRAAGKLLSHLIEYLRAALPQLRASSTTLEKEVGLAAAYLNILQTRMGSRLDFGIDVPAELAQHPFPPNLLISLVENAIKHGVEPAADGGTIRVVARREGDQVVISVIDTGRGNVTPAVGQPGDGIGLANVRERLAALYGPHGRFTLAEEKPHGTRATLSIPFETLT